MPIAVTGTGRCGTSMVTRMLGICGAYIGEAADMESPPDGDNPNGYWEHKALRGINTRILAHFGGSEKSPPLLAENWWMDPGLAPITDEARSVIDRSFSRRGEWAWKDPRTCTTAPFWLRVEPAMKFVLCMRNPLDVARSLSRHVAAHDAHQYRFEGAHGHIIWYFYNAAILSAVPSCSLIVTHYEDYFPDYSAALAPVLNFVGLSSVRARSEQDTLLRDLHDGRLRHHGGTLLDVMSDPRVPYIVRELYLQIADGKEDGRLPEILRFSDALIPLAHLVAANEYALSELRRTEAILATRPHKLATSLSKIVNAALPHRAAKRRFGKTQTQE